MDPAAQTCDSIVVHEGTIGLVLLHLQEVKLFPYFLHLAFIRLFKVTFVSLKLLTIMTIDVIGQIVKLIIEVRVSCLLFSTFRPKQLIACQICHENTLVIRVSIWRVSEVVLHLAI